MIKSRFVWFIYLLSLLLIALFIFAIYFFVHPDLRSNGKDGTITPPALFGCIFLITAAIIFVRIAKKILLVRINNEAIFLKGFFSNQTLNRNEIKSINLLAMHNAYVASSTISTIIEMENGSTYVIEDPFYQNISSIKQYLNTHYREKIVPVIKPPSAISTVSTENGLERISGDRFFNFNTIAFLGFVILVTFFTIKIPSSRPTYDLAFVMLFAILVPYFAFAYQQYYFLVSNEQIVIKNIFLPWVHKTFDLDQVIATNIELENRKSFAFRVTTNGFRSKSYVASSLRKKDWTRLKEILQSRSINCFSSVI